jgi:putative nucleotidyltransferase with HDIG domain
MEPTKAVARQSEECRDSKSKILVVDDEASIARLLCEKLMSEGFECRECHSGLEALDLLVFESFNAMISDHNMPGMSGLELLKLVRERHPHVAFIMATGVDDVRLGVQAMKEGADDYLVKPLNFEAMMVSVDRVLEKKRLEIEVENYRKNLENMVDQRTKQLQVAMRRIELTYDDTLEALAAALDLRDNETAGHSRRVMAYCVEIAVAMGYNQEQVKVIARGALLHDIGKIGIPDTILLKPGPLTEKDRSVMETHVRIGCELLSRIAFLAGAAEIVLTHHERFDGTGYPQGLVGSEIPLGARIFAVADTLDAITSDRPYRRAKSYAEAREEIAKGSGSQFDAAVVSAFLSIGEPAWEAIRQEKGTRTAASIARVNPAYLTLAAGA